MRRPVSLLLLAAVLIACEGDREPVADPEQPTETTTSTPAPPESSTSTPAAVDPEFAEWCAAAADLDEATSAMETIDPTDAEAVESAIALMVERTESAAPLAPDAISDDVAVQRDLLVRLDEALAAADYDFLEADLSGVATDDAAEQANARIASFNVETCGFEPEADEPAAAPDDPADDGPVFDPADGSVRDQTIALLVDRGFTEEEAGCLFDNMDLADPELATDQTALLELVETCKLDLERLAGLGQ